MTKNRTDRTNGRSPSDSGDEPEKATIRILLLEDSATDAELVRHASSTWKPKLPSPIGSKNGSPT
jgi:hypothetical protein